MYNEALADAILQALHEVFPNKVSLRSLQQMLPGFSKAPDGDWLAALNVLHKGGLLAGTLSHVGAHHATAGAESLEITREGRLRARQLIAKLEAPQVDRSSDLDALLLIYTRAHFDQDLEWMSAAAFSWRPLSLVMMDVDQIEDVKRTPGRTAGEEVLKTVAMLIRRACEGKGPCYRYANESFAILLCNYTARESVGLVERIQDSVSKEVFPAGVGRITVSAGVAVLANHTDGAVVLRQNALEALALAKQRGRNLVCPAGD
jgi:diguanylate cyclase (GGDEF)-like protein